MEKKINNMATIAVLELCEEQEQRFVCAKYVYLNDNPNDTCLGYRYFYVWKGVFFHCSERTIHALNRGEKLAWEAFEEAKKSFREEYLTA